jgi:hypothetical protein
VIALPTNPTGDDFEDFIAAALRALGYFIETRVVLREGMKLLHAHPHSLKLPYLFQVFTELLGGYIFPGMDDEIELMESMTGVPKDQIVPSLKLLDQFFSKKDGTSFYYPKGQILILKMVPAFARGIESFLRLKVFGLKHYDQKYPDFGWLLNKWHRAAYEILEPELKAAGPVPAPVPQPGPQPA